MLGVGLGTHRSTEEHEAVVDDRDTSDGRGERRGVQGTIRGHEDLALGDVDF